MISLLKKLFHSFLNQSVNKIEQHDKSEPLKTKYNIDFVSIRQDGESLKNVSVEFTDHFNQILIDKEDYFLRTIYVENEGLSSDKKYYRIATPDFKFWINKRDVRSFMENLKERHINFIESRIEQHNTTVKELSKEVIFDPITDDIYKCFIAYKTGLSEEVGSHKKLIEAEAKINEVCMKHGGKCYKTKAKSANFAIIFSIHSRYYSNVEGLRDAGYKVTTFENALRYFGLENKWDCDKLARLSKEHFESILNHSKNELEKFHLLKKKF